MLHKPQKLRECWWDSSPLSEDTPDLPLGSTCCSLVQPFITLSFSNLIHKESLHSQVPIDRFRPLAPATYHGHQVSLGSHPVVELSLPVAWRVEGRAVRSEMMEKLDKYPSSNGVAWLSWSLMCCCYGSFQPENQNLLRNTWLSISALGQGGPISFLLELDFYIYRKYSKMCAFLKKFNSLCPKKGKNKQTNKHLCHLKKEPKYCLMLLELRLMVSASTHCSVADMVVH